MRQCCGCAENSRNLPSRLNIPWLPPTPQPRAAPAVVWRQEAAAAAGRHKIQTLATVMGTSILATLALALVAVSAQFVEVKFNRYIGGDMSRAMFYVILNKK